MQRLQKPVERNYIWHVCSSALSNSLFCHFSKTFELQLEGHSHAGASYSLGQAHLSTDLGTESFCG